MRTSISESARKISIGIIALILLCGGVGIWSSWQLRGALTAQASAGDLLRNHMTADMMHDAVRSDVLALLLAQHPECGSAWKRDPGSGVIGVEKGPLIPVV